ncbi:uncharacterized protein LOC62_06G007797 [Vanrija pseudolonga]|uniref:Ig-like domain-containing protein n=1 Tax=Vanrija pseudolonga TaxID=143232 RepID=A0AAF0YD77_9TREE|nr:hypothetical protein LOC62_06G007797 [Vanrija pseudolonga]
MKFAAILIALAAVAYAAPAAEADSVVLEGREADAQTDELKREAGVSLRGGYCYRSLEKDATGPLMSWGDRVTITCRATGPTRWGHNDYFFTNYGCWVHRPSVVTSNAVMDGLPVC